MQEILYASLSALLLQTYLCDLCPCGKKGSEGCMGHATNGNKGEPHVRAQDFCEFVQHLFFFDDIPDLDI